MRLRNPKPSYSPTDERERNREIEQADRNNFKLGQDNNIGDGRLIWTDETNGTLYQVFIDSDSVFLRNIATGATSAVGGGGGGSGTVTSVAVSGSDGIEVDSGSPITTSGTIALGIDAAALRTHLNVQDGATDNQTDLEIKTAYENNLDTNVFDDAAQTKLAGIEAGATADQTGAEIKVAYEGEANTNAFTDAEQTKLAGIEASADVTDTANVTAAGALMDSEVTNLAQVKAFSSADYATAAQGTTADSALQPGDNGIGGTAADLTDMDDLDAGGVYRFETTDTNKPGASNSAGTVWHSKWNATSYFQIAHTSFPAADENKLFIRVGDGTTWEAWEQLGKQSAVFYALGSGSANLGTSLGTVPLATAVKEDTGYTLASNQVTIGSELDGKWAEVSWSVTGNGATGRVEIRSELQVNSTKVKGARDYTARDATQDGGGVSGSHVLQLSTSDVIRVQALRDGSTANLVADETHLCIKTLD